MTENNDNINVGQWVPKYYQMNPDTEDFIFDGTDLQVGMVVLVAKSDYRADERGIKDLGQEVTVSPFGSTKVLTRDDMDPLIDILNENNRWCEIDRVEIDDHDHKDGQSHRLVSFLGRYSDGTLRKRVYDVAIPWLARKEEKLNVPDDLGGFDDEQPA